MGEKTNAPHHMSDNHKPKLSAKKAGIALALVLALGLGSCDKKSPSSQTELIKKVPTPAQLKGRKVNDLYSYYLGYGGKKTEIGDEIAFNPNEVISLLYEKKFRSIPNGFQAAKEYYDDVVSKIDFTKSKPITISQYQESIQTVVNDINNTFDRNLFCKQKLGGNKEKSAVFEKICRKIDAKSLMAYSMTELFPSMDTMNKEILKFLLQYGGEDLVYHLPAVNDDYASFGPYQFTSFAVYNAEGQKKGASILNDFLPPDVRIPGSVTKLKKEDHHKAAYLFAMCNIYVLLKDKANLPALKLLSQKNPNNIVQLIAIMHNKPVQGAVFLQERYRLNSNPKYLYKQSHTKKGKLSYVYDTNKNGSIDIYESKLQPFPSHGYGKKTSYNRNILK